MWPWWNLLEQVHKLQNIIASRATQYSHDAKRKEREAAKLKERLSQLLIDRKDKKLGEYRQIYAVLPRQFQDKRFWPVSPFLSCSYWCTEQFGARRWKTKPLEDSESDSQVK